MADQVQRWADPETLARLADYPCFRCLSDQQLLLVLGVVLCIILEPDPDNACTPQELMQNGACAHCFSDRQLLQILVAIISKYAADNGLINNMDVVIQNATCLNCVDPKLVRSIIVSEIQRGIDNGTLFARQ